MGGKPPDRWERAATPYGRVFEHIRTLWQKARPDHPVDDDLLGELLDQVRPFDGEEVAWLNAARARLNL